MEAKKKLALKLTLLAWVFMLSNCRKAEPGDYRNAAANPEYLHSAEQKLTEVMVHDIFSPVVASRIYLYANLAAYEALVPAHPDYQSLAGQLRDLDSIPQPQKGQQYCHPLASLKAFMAIARSLTFSVEKYDDFEKQLFDAYADMMPQDVYERSVQYGEAVGKRILAYSAGDNYKQTRGFRYTLTQKPGDWAPTPPAYMDAVEPYWGKIRCAVMDSAAQFALPAPPPFSTDKNSAFFKEMAEVYEITGKLTGEQDHIANFWDCNPFKVNVSGHVNFATKKMSPGGHWISIAGTVARQQKLDLMRTTEAYCLTSIALFDGFIACWNDKYRTVKIRPETVINQYMDKDWVPLLQTPPFPEYPSGHSVISSASAVVLTKLMGDNIAYTDSTEVQYGIPARRFTSFNQAAAEAGLSRLYGGIHFRSAVVDGARQGTQVGQWVTKNVQTRRMLATNTAQKPARQ